MLLFPFSLFDLEDMGFMFFLTLLPISLSNCFLPLFEGLFDQFVRLLFTLLLPQIPGGFPLPPFRTFDRLDRRCSRQRFGKMQVMIITLEKLVDFSVGWFFAENHTAISGSSVFQNGE
jgi:hypothetical protein